MTPPLGVETDVVIPLMRAIGMNSLAGLKPSYARRCGLKSPISDVSFVAEIEPTSISPSCDAESISPG